MNSLGQPAVLAGARRVLVAGCGFVGLEAARKFHAMGWAVTGMTRSSDSAQRLASELFPVRACDINDAAGLAALGSFEVVVDCVSSNGGEAEDYRRTYLQGARTLLETTQPARFVFTSSTSVYAQMDGSVVTEESPAEPGRETGRILRETEDGVLAAGGVVLRLAGLYGPGRWALLRNFREGRNVLEGDGNRWTNHLHRDDAAAAIVFVCTHEAPPGIYNVTDETPVTQRQACEILAEHFKRPFPTAGPAVLHRKRGWSSKRVSNAKLRSLGWTLQFPSFGVALDDEVKASPSEQSSRCSPR